MSGMSVAEMAVQGRDVPWLLSQWAKRAPTKDFLIWAPRQGQHRRWTYADFDRDVRKVAAGLRQQGFQPGQRLLIHMDNCPEYLMAYFACAHLGLVAVLSNSRSTDRELAYFVDLTEVSGVFTQPEYAAIVREAAPDLLLWVTEDNAGTPVEGEQDPGINAQPFNSLLANEPSGENRSPEPMRDLRVQFTSGTTSRPKAVLSTHANSLFAAQQTAQVYGLRADDIALAFVPLFHTNGLSVIVMSTLWVGGTIVLQRKFSASQFWPVALQYRATWTSLPGPFFIRALWQQPVPEHHFRFWYVAVLPEAEKHFKVKTRGHWGMTEMITLPIVSDPHHSDKPLCIGRPLPGNDIAIRRPDGSPCNPGETGHLYVRGIRGVTLFKEYLNNPEATAAAFDKNGWFETGDRVHIDQDGNLFFAGRAADQLRVGGENVAAAEIEAVIQSVDWVRECAVVGQPDPMLEEVPVAYVTLEAHAPQNVEEALISHCAKHLADFKVIRQAYVVEDFPRTAIGKIAKHALRTPVAPSSLEGA